MKVIKESWPLDHENSSIFKTQTNQLATSIEIKVLNPTSVK